RGPVEQVRPSSLSECFLIGPYEEVTLPIPAHVDHACDGTTEVAVLYGVWARERQEEFARNRAEEVCPTGVIFPTTLHHSTDEDMARPVAVRHPCQHEPEAAVRFGVGA